jgi:hypothetical protein
VKLNDLRIAPISLAQLPKLDVAGSSPVARSRNSFEFSTYENRLPFSAGDFLRSTGNRNGNHALRVW